MKKDAVLDTLIPLPSYLFSPRARLLLGLHVLGSLLIGNVRIVAYQNSYYVSEFMALRQSLSDWIFDYLSKHNITLPCRAWIQPITE